MRSSALVTVSQEAVEMSDNTTMKQERKQSMRVLEEKRWEVGQKRGRHSKQWKRRLMGGLKWFCEGLELLQMQNKWMEKEKRENCVATA